EPMTERRLQLARERFVGERRYALRFGRGQSPDRSRPTRRQRQQRDRPVRCEAFKRAALERRFGRAVEDAGALLVVMLGNAYTERGAQRRARTVGCNREL